MRGVARPRAGFPLNGWRLLQAAWLRAPDRLLNRGVLGAALLLSGLRYAVHAPLQDTGWKQWIDQSMYLRSAHAWAAGDLDPGQHWYLPGYPLTGAVFARVMPGQPFWIPDLLCLLVSVCLGAALSARLSPSWPRARAAGAFTCFVTMALTPRMLEVWAVPWSTTPAVPLTLAALLLALRFDERPEPRTAGLAALATVAVGLFRPTEAAVLLMTVPPYMAWRLVARWPGWRPGGATILSASLGAAVAGAILVAAHVSVFGWQPSPYMLGSAMVGFEWRRIPLQWVTLFLSPQPMLATRLPGGIPGGTGMVGSLPWVIPGLVGMAAALITRGPRRGHGLVVAVAGLQTVAYLAYRDMHPDGLWQFENYHYFKLPLLLLGLYTAALPHAAGTRLGRRGIMLACVLVSPLLFWRASFERTGLPGAVVEGNRVILPGGLLPMDAAVAVTASGTWSSIYKGDTRIAVPALSGPGLVWSNNSGVKALPAPGGFVAVPLRPMPAAPAVLSLDPSVRLDASVPPVALRQVIHLALPCVAPRLMPGCAVPYFSAGRVFPLGTAVPFDGPEAPYLLDGWSEPAPDGRWTEGARAGLLLRPAGLAPGAAAATLSLAVHAYLPARPTMRAMVTAGGIPLAEWRFDDERERTVTVEVPTRLLDATGSILLQIDTDAPARSPDRRWLGLHVGSMSLD